MHSYLFEDAKPMLDPRNSIHSYRLTTIRSQQGRFDQSSYGVRMVGRPSVGRPLVMYGGDGNERIVTSKVVRLFNGLSETGTYVETKNTLYFLEGAQVPQGL